MFQDKNVPRRFSSSPGSGLTHRMAASQLAAPPPHPRHLGSRGAGGSGARRNLAQGSDNDCHMSWARTQSSQAEALYNEVVGSASQKPTDVIVVSSKSSTASDQDFKVFVGRLEAEVGTSPGITDVVANFGSDKPAGLG